MITYQTVTDFNPKAILKLYDAVFWSNYTAQPKRLMAGLRNSLLVLAAFDGEELVGLCRLVGDGVTIVFVQDLLVLPAYQGQGIGSNLLKQVLTKYHSCYQIHLLTEQSPKTDAFYQSLGFRPVADLACQAYTYVRQE